MKKIITTTAFTLAALTAFTQNVGIGTNAPHSSAALEIQSSDKGMLIPRMTTAQRTAISNAATGLLVFDNTTGTFWFYNGTAWTELVTNTNWSKAGNNIYNNNTGNVGIGTSTIDPDAKLQVQSAGASKVVIGGPQSSGGLSSMVMGTSANTGGYSYIQSIKNAGSLWGDIMLNPVDGNVGIGTSSTNSSAILDVQSTSKGVLIPRMSLAQRDAIASPANSLMIYQVDGNPGYYYNKGTPSVKNWQPVAGPRQAFSSSATSNQTIAPNVNTKISFQSAFLLNEGNTYDPATSTFTAPETGVYYLQAGLVLQSVDAGQYSLFIDNDLNNSGAYASDILVTAGISYANLKVSAVQWLAEGSQVVIGLHHNASTPQITFNGSGTYFQGYRIY